MTSLRRIGGVAAVGALAMGIALFTGPPAANAGDTAATASSPAGATATTTQNELQQLRANQELLQRRLDQLAQVGLQKPKLPAGTVSIAGSFPRSFLIPGTNTSIQIGGFVDLHASYFFQGGGNNTNAAVPPGTGVALAAGIPTSSTFDEDGRSRSNGWFRMAASESRMFVETRTPTPWGQAISHLEFDFYGCTSGAANCTHLNRATNPDLPRLRLAYGTLGGFIAGQTWVPGNDLASGAETFDFFGQPGGWGYARSPQIGYKFPLSWMHGATLGLYIVKPSAELATPLGGTESDSLSGDSTASPIGGTNLLKDPAPDAAFVLNFEQPWGHLQFHGAILDAQVKAGSFLDKSYVGYGGGFSGKVHPFMGYGGLLAKDNIGFDTYACEACGHWGGNWTGGSTNTNQMLASNITDVPASTAAASAVLITTVTQWGGKINYQHWWTPTLRSTVAWGIGHEDLPLSLLAPAGETARNKNYNKELQVVDVNLIWSPVPFINTGFEYTWDHRKTVFNHSGDAHILSYDFRVRF